MGTVFVLNAIALFVFPTLGHALHLTQAQFGTWSGVAIHDISSVVGAASHYGQSALYTATAVKLSRALWIVPISVAASYIFQHQHKKSGENVTHKPQIPWFIGLFLLASVARTFIPQVETWSPVVTGVSEAGLTNVAVSYRRGAIPANVESGWLETNDARGGVVDIYQRLFTWGHSISRPLVFFDVAFLRYESGCRDVAVLRLYNDVGPHVKSFSYMESATPFF